MVIGSVTYEGGYSGYSVLFKANDSEQLLKVQSGSGVALPGAWPKGDFGDIGMKGDLFVIELPAGTYTFHSWNVSSGIAHINPTAPFGISFVVKPGQAVYVGNFNFEQTNRFGLTVTGVSVSFSDQFKRDMTLFRFKYQNVELGGINRGVEEGLFRDALGGEGSTYIDPLYIPVF